MSKLSFYQEAELYATQKARRAKAVVSSIVDNGFLSLSEKTFLKNHLVYKKKASETQLESFTEEKQGSSVTSETSARRASLSQDNDIFEYHSLEEESAENDASGAEMNLELNLSLPEGIIPPVVETEPEASTFLGQIPTVAGIAADLFLTSFGLNPVSSKLRSSSKAKKNFEEGVNFSRKMDHFHHHSSANLNGNRKAAVGNLTVRVRCVENVDPSVKFFFIVEVADSTFTSPTIFPNSKGVLTWEIGPVFPVDDMFGDVRIQLVQSAIISDALLGQVIIPVAHFLPGFNETLETKKKIEGWYQVFPLTRQDMKKFRPAIRDISGSGMKRPEKAIPKILLSCEMTLSSDFKSHWDFLKFYMNPPVRLRRNISEEYVALNVNMPSDLSENFSEIYRHYYRIYAVLETLLYPTTVVKESLSFILAWESPALSMALLACAFAGIYNENFPQEINIKNSVTYLFGVVPLLVLVSIYWFSFTHWRKETYTDGPEIPLVWNDQTVVSSSNLTNMQRLMKATHVLKKIEDKIAFIADSSEKILNIFSWADRRATFLALIYTSILVMGISFLGFALNQIEGQYLLFGLVSALFMPGMLSRLTGNGNGTRRRKKNILAIYVINLWNSIPTTDEKAHRIICQMQKCSGSIPDLDNADIQK